MKEDDKRPRRFTFRQAGRLLSFSLEAQPTARRLTAAASKRLRIEKKQRRQAGYHLPENGQRRRFHPRKKPRQKVSDKFSDEAPQIEIGIGRRSSQKLSTHDEPNRTEKTISNSPAPASQRPATRLANIFLQKTKLHTRRLISSQFSLRSKASPPPLRTPNRRSKLVRYLLCSPLILCPFYKGGAPPA